MIRTEQLSNDAVFNEFCKRLRAAANKRRKATWELVDELFDAETSLGDRFSQAVEVTLLTPEAIENYMRTGRAWPADKRFLNMPFDYHTALNSLDPEQRYAAINMAQKAEWKRDELRWRIAAWKEGDKLAFDPRHKVSKPERKARLSAQTPTDDSHAGVGNGEDDTPVADKGALGAALKSEGRREVLEGLREQNLSSANQRILNVLAELKAMRTDGEFLRALDAEGLNPDAIRLEGQWLINVAGEVSAVQSINWNKKPAPKAASNEAGAGKAVGGATPPGPASSAADDFDEIRDMPDGLRRTGNARA